VTQQYSADKISLSGHSKESFSHILHTVADLDNNQNLTTSKLSQVK